MSFGKPPPSQKLDFSSRCVNHGDNKSKSSGWNDPHLDPGHMLGGYDGFKTTSSDAKIDGEECFIVDKEALIMRIQSAIGTCSALSDILWDALAVQKRTAADVSTRLSLLTKEIEQGKLGESLQILVFKIFKGIEEKRWDSCLTIVAQLQVVAIEEEQMKWSLGVKRLITLMQRLSTA